MEEIIKIRCPYCGAVLSVKNQFSIESKNVTCPICKQKSPFKDFKKILDGIADESTQYPDKNKQKSHHTLSDPGTEIAQKMNFTLGRLIVMQSGAAYQLKFGKNVIGRKTSRSVADIQIPTENNKRLSREHLVIEIKRIQEKGFVHYASLCKQKTNNTYVGTELLEYGDCVILNHGDIIRLPDITVKFEIPDNDETEF